MKVSKRVVAMAILLALVMVPSSLVIVSDVINTYRGNMRISTTQPIKVTPGSFLYQTPCGQLLIQSQWAPTGTGFSGSMNLPLITLSTTNGYRLMMTPIPMFSLTTSTSGVLTLGINTNPYIASAYLNIGGTTQQVYPGTGTWSLTTGSYTANLTGLTLTTPVTGTVTLSGNYNFTPTTGVTFTYTFTETLNLKQPSFNIMNLLNGYQNWYVPHVYQGDYQGTRTYQWPVYYPLSAAPQYWAPISTGINQPVLMMVQARQWSAGAMFWSEAYTSGQSVTITILGTYSSGTSNPADGYEFYFFIVPNGWAISSSSNYSIPYSVSSSQIGTQVSPVQGEVILPVSVYNTWYVVVQWDPYWQYGYTASGYTGQWNVWAVSYTPSRLRINSVNGVGSGYFKPNPGDYICVSVTYNATTNTVSGIAVDLNTGAYAILPPINLASFSNFKPPNSGTYVFGVAGNTGGAYANWAILAVNYTAR
ncbi:hypothetical protein [Caldivirga maquilingensis]|uniref:Uncharacterized protein n=1 Tax=Caldivirga maquilingensis (strain ATCC 700844 / DSM 13496 / JCM 10307 / IC-167) TaxID=397948 RepID=A8MA45_CALMQ|nr:hypothetical protein [Caldivirga maquilingensis]ABW00977.1 hypothetical protein Cmaq_0125 [Caldivirga maquilingensis IC-167]